MNDCAAKVVLISDAMAATARDCLANRGAMPGVTHIVSIGPVDDLPDWRTLCAGEAPSPIDDEAIGGRMVYSSGTTGRPKGLKFASATGNPIQPNPGATLFDRFYDLGKDCIYLSPAPLYHAAPMGITAGIQAVGGTAVVMQKFDPEAFLRAIEQYG